MRSIAAGLLLASISLGPTLAQERDRSLERISLALERPAPVIGAGSVLELPDAPLTFGPFTLVPPQLRGEMVRVSFPIGAYVMKAVRGVAQANRRRQEAAARREVAAQTSALGL